MGYKVLPVRTFRRRTSGVARAVSRVRNIQSVRVAVRARLGRVKLGSHRSGAFALRRKSAYGESEREREKETEREGKRARAREPRCAIGKNRPPATTKITSNEPRSFISGASTPLSLPSARCSRPSFPLAAFPLCDPAAPRPSRFSSQVHAFVCFAAGFRALRNIAGVCF